MVAMNAIIDQPFNLVLDLREFDRLSIDIELLLLFRKINSMIE